MPTPDRPLTLCVTGNVASGKSTFARLLSETLPAACYVPEPYDSNPFLPLYLRDQSRWGFTSTLRYFWDYAHTFARLTAQQEHRYHIVDAGIWTNRMVYADYLCGEGIIHADEYAFFCELSQAIARDCRHGDADAFVFINVSPEVSLKRMSQRGWDFQVGAIDLTYLAKLNHYLERMKQRVTAEGYPVLELSSEEMDFTEPAGQAEALNRTGRFLDQLHQLSHA